MIYTWKVVNTTIKDSPDTPSIVVSCNWVKSGEDENGNLGQFYGCTTFDINTVDYDSFIPFDELTEDIVLSWIQDRIDENFSNHIDKVISDDIEKKLYPEITVIPPWENNQQ